MSMLQTLLDGVTTNSFYYYVGNILLAVTVVAIVTLLLVSLLRGRSARLRQALLYIGLAFVLLAPFSASVWPSFDLAIFRHSALISQSQSQDQGQVEPHAFESPSGASLPVQRSSGSDVAAIPAMPELELTPAPLPANEIPWYTILMLIWAGVAIYLVAKIGLGQLQLWRFSSRLSVINTPELIAAAKTAAAHLGMKRLPDLMESATLSTPVSFGCFRHRVAFPKDFARGMTEEDLCAIAIHEFSHLTQRHQILRPLQCVIRALFWWHPAVILMDRKLRRAQEEVCDNCVLEFLGDGRSFARCLLELAEKSAKPRFTLAAAGLMDFRGELESRVRNLLRNDGGTMKRIGVVGVVSLLFFAVSAAGLQAGLTISQEKEKEEKAQARDIRNWFPLATGAVWNWRFVATTNAKKPGKPVQKSWSCIRQVAASGGKRAWEIRTLQGRYKSWEYWSVEKDGIYHFKSRYKGGMRGVSKRHKPTRLVPGPLLSEKDWEWTEMGSVQTSGGAAYPSKEVLRMHYTGRIAALSEKVKVPAGEYRALKIQINMTSKYFGNTEVNYWFARGVGLVKKVSVGKTTTHTVELLSFKAGKEMPDNLDATIRQQIKRQIKQHKSHSLLGKPSAIELVTGLEAYVSSRFYVVRWGKNPAPAYFRHHAGETTLFPPTLPGSWRKLIASEGIRLSQEDAMVLTKAYGLLVAHYDGTILDAVARGTAVAVKSNDKYDVKAWIVGKTKKEKKTRGYAHMWFDKGKLVQMSSNLATKTAAIPGPANVKVKKKPGGQRRK